MRAAGKVSANARQNSVRRPAFALASSWAPVSDGSSKRGRWPAVSGYAWSLSSNPFRTAQTTISWLDFARSLSRMP